MAFRTYELYLDVTYVAKPVAAVTVPANGSTITDTNIPVVSWSRTLDVDGGPQTSWAMKIFTEAQYTAAGFDPATSTATVSLADANANSSTAISTALADGIYRAYVRVAQTVNGVGHNSDFAYSQFTISVALPAAPSVTLTPDAPSGRMLIALAPNTGPATTDAMEIQYSDGGPVWLPLRTYKGSSGEYVMGLARTYYDYEARNGAYRTYRARALHDYSGKYAASAWVQATATWSADQWWLKDVLAPSRNLPVELVSYTGIQRPARRGVLQALGASRPLVVADTRGGEEGTFIVQCRTVAEQTALEAFVLASGTVFLQGPQAHGEPDRFVAFGDMSTDRVIDKGLFPTKRSTLAWTQVDTPAGAQADAQYVA